MRNDWGVWGDAGPARIDGSEVTATTRFGCYPCQDQARQWYRLAVAAPIGLARTDSVSLASTPDPPTLALVSVWRIGT